MDEQTFKKLLAEALDPIKETLQQHTEILQQHTESLQQHTESLVNVESTNKIYGDMYKLNNDNMKRLERRAEKLEKNARIEPEPDDTLAALH